MEDKNLLEQDGIDKRAFTKVKDHLNSENFPYYGSETHLLDAKNRPKGLEVEQMRSTNFTSEQEACHILPNDLVPNFGQLPRSSHLSRKSKGPFEEWSVEDVFNEHNSASVQQREIQLIYSAHEENSKLIKIVAEPTVSLQNNEEFEEHKNSDKSCHRLSENDDSICDIINFVEPAFKLYAVLNTDSAVQEANSELKAGFPWVKRESLDYLKRENYDELWAFLGPVITKEFRITDYQALFTFLNARNSLAFPIFSYNLLQYLDGNGNCLSKGTLNFFAIYHERRRVIQSFSVTLWAIFEVRVNNSLDGFIFRVDVLERFLIFNGHSGVREFMELLRCLFKKLKTIFADLVLCKNLAWKNPQNLNKYDEIDSKRGSPEYARRKLCELIEDLEVFMKENKWVFLLELSTEHLKTLAKGFKEAENVLNICLNEIVVMIDRNII